MGSMFLTKRKILELYDNKDIIIRPLLSQSQFGEVSLDLRLGGDFLVTFQGREPYIDTTGDKNSRPINSFFQETKRLLGETFYLHPSQTVLCSTLEYIKIPDNIFLTLTTRSSFSRLGLTISSFIQPGYCGCIPLELTNNNNTPIKLLVGASIIQARFYQLNESTNYFSKQRKYACQVRPVSSKADNDPEIERLKGLFDI